MLYPAGACAGGSGGGGGGCYGCCAQTSGATLKIGAKTIPNRTAYSRDADLGRYFLRKFKGTASMNLSMSPNMNPRINPGIGGDQKDNRCRC